MRKLMIAMLALAVVFGFAACDNNSGSTSLMDQYVVALEVTGPEAYFAGETVEKDDLTVTAVRNDGAKVELTENDYDLVSSVPDSAVSATAKEETVATVTYTGIYQGTIKAPTAVLKATVYNVDAINVEGPAVAQYYNTQDADDFDYSAYTVTSYALAKSTDNASAALYSKSETATKGVFDFSSAITSTTFNTGNWEVPVDGGIDAISGGKNSINITVKPDNLVGITLSLKDGAEAIVGATRSAVAASSLVDVSYTMESGEVLTSASGFTAATPAWVGTSTTLTASESIKASTLDMNGKEVSATPLNITPVSDYVKSFTIGDVASVLKVSGTTMTVAENAKLDTSKMTVTLTWAGSGTTTVTGNVTAPSADDLTKALKIVVGGTTEQATFETTGYKTGDNLPISFSLTGLGNIETVKIGDIS